MGASAERKEDISGHCGHLLSFTLSSATVLKKILLYPTLFRRKTGFWAGFFQRSVFFVCGQGRFSSAAGPA